VINESFLSTGFFEKLCLFVEWSLFGPECEITGESFEPVPRRLEATMGKAFRARENRTSRKIFKVQVAVA
jgi:hypothetical protein